MTTSVLEDFEQGDVDNFPCDFKTVIQETNDSHFSIANIVESEEILDKNGENIPSSYFTNAPDVVRHFSGRSVWVEPENVINCQTENTEKNKPDLSSLSKHKPDTHDGIDTDSSPSCVNADYISPDDLPDILKRKACCQTISANDSISSEDVHDVLKGEHSSQDANIEHSNPDTSSENKAPTEGLKVEPLQRNGKSVDIQSQIAPLTDRFERQIPSGILNVTKTVLSPADSLKRKVGLIVSKTGLEERVASRTSKLSPEENNEGSLNETEDDRTKVEECKDKPTPVTNKFKRAFRTTAILTIIWSFFSIGVSVVKATASDPEKSVSLILSTVFNTLSSVMIIVPAVIGLAFGKIQARLQNDNPPIILKCCLPLHLGFSVACVVFGVMSFVASVSGLFVCSAGTCSEDQILILGLDIVQVISALFTIGANIFGIVFFCKTRTSLMRVLPSVPQKLNDSKAKTLKLKIADNSIKDGNYPNDKENK